MRRRGAAAAVVDGVERDLRSPGDDWMRKSPCRFRSPTEAVRPSSANRPRPRPRLRPPTAAAAADGDPAATTAVGMIRRCWRDCGDGGDGDGSLHCVRDDDGGGE